MQKTFTILFLSILWSAISFAQDVCIPGQVPQDMEIILPEPFNTTDMEGGLDSTCIGLFYEQVLTVLPPSTFPVNGQNFSIDSISIEMEGAIEGLPPGFEYACNPPSCIFLPMEPACIVITGMADETVTPMTYELSLQIRAFNAIIDGLFPKGFFLNFPDDLGNDDESYFIDVASEADCNITVSTTFLADNIDASISPNPTASYAELRVNSNEAMDLQLVLVDLVGKIHQQQSISIVSGQNIIPMQVQELAQGMYFMSLSNGEEFLSHKLIIE